MRTPRELQAEGGRGDLAEGTRSVLLQIGRTALTITVAGLVGAELADGGEESAGGWEPPQPEGGEDAAPDAAAPQEPTAADPYGSSGPQQVATAHPGLAQHPYAQTPAYGYAPGYASSGAYGPAAAYGAAAYPGVAYPGVPFAGGAGLGDGATGEAAAGEAAPSADPRFQSLNVNGCLVSGCGCYGFTAMAYGDNTCDSCGHGRGSHQR